MVDIIVGGITYENLEEKDQASILAIQDLTQQIRRLAESGR